MHCAATLTTFRCRQPRSGWARYPRALCRATRPSMQSANCLRFSDNSAPLCRLLSAKKLVQTKAGRWCACTPSFYRKAGAKGSARTVDHVWRRRSPTSGAPGGNNYGRRLCARLVRLSLSMALNVVLLSTGRSGTARCAQGRGDYGDRRRAGSHFCPARAGGPKPR